MKKIALSLVLATGLELPAAPSRQTKGKTMIDETMVTQWTLDRDGELLGGDISIDVETEDGLCAKQWKVFAMDGETGTPRHALAVIQLGRPNRWDDAALDAVCDAVTAPRLASTASVDALDDEQAGMIGGMRE